MARLTSVARCAGFVLWGLLLPCATAIGEEAIVLPPIEKSTAAKAPSDDIGLMPGVPLAPHQIDPSTLTMGIIDSGIRKDHPQIGDIVVAERDFTGEGIYDDLGHGTMVVLSALKDHYDAIAELGNVFERIKSPSVFAIAKVIGRAPTSEQEVADRMVKAIEWLGQIRAKIVNISLAMQEGAADYAALCAAIAAQEETVFGVAAGNLGPDAVVYPAACSTTNIIVVGAVGSDGTVPDYSGRADLVGRLPPALVPMADYLRQQGDRLVQVKDLEGARQAYERGLTEHPTTEVRSLLEYGLAYIAKEQGDDDAALAHFKASAEAWPAYAEPYVAVSLLLTGRADFEEARVWLEKGLAASPENPRLLDRLTRVLLDLGQPEQALVHIEKLERLQPDLDGLADLRSAARDMANVARSVEAGQKPLDLLYLFSEVGDARLVQFLIRRFRPPLDDVPAERKVPALVIAAINGHRAVLRVLTEEGANIDLQASELEVTALMVAANGGHDRAVGLLIELGAALDVVDSYGFTALMFAAEQGYQDVARLLLEAGADIVPKSQEQLDARGYALKHGHQEIVDLIDRAQSCPRLRCAQ